MLCFVLGALRIRILSASRAGDLGGLRCAAGVPWQQCSEAHGLRPAFLIFGHIFGLFQCTFVVDGYSLLL